jgi:hypothetical protein
MANWTSIYGTVLTEVNIELIRQLIEENPHWNYKELERDSGINRFTIWEIIWCRKA